MNTDLQRRILSLAAGALSQGQRHGRDNGDQQHDTCHLEGQQVLGLGQTGLLVTVHVVGRVVRHHECGRPIEAVDPGKRGAADISFAAQYTAALGGLGVVGRGAHTPDETVDLRSIPVMAKRAALLAYRLGTETGH